MPASPPKLTFLPDVLEEHYEELQFLWGVRKHLLRSPRAFSRDLLDFEDRIDAHAQGMQIAGDRLPEILGGGLQAKDPRTAFAAGYVMLSARRPAWQDEVLSAFAASTQPGTMQGLKEALSHAEAGSLLNGLRNLLETAPPLRAVSVLEILAFRGDVARPPMLQRFIADDAAVVRRLAWRVASLTGTPLDPKSYSAGLRDPDLAVRAEAMEAAAWARQAGVLAYCRTVSSNPDPARMDALRLLAVIGQLEDLPVLLAAGQNVALGPQRFAVLGAYGHPAAVATLIENLADSDPAVAVAAASAFTRITGADIDSAATSEVPLDQGKSGFDAEFTSPVALPDAAKALKHWRSVEPQFASTTRLCFGHDCSHGTSREALASFSLESRWEACLRSRFHGVFTGRALDLEMLRRRSS